MLLKRGIYWTFGLSLLMCISIGNAQVDQDNCLLDDDGRNEDLDRCLRKGDRFIGKYLKQLGRGNGKNKFDKCSAFEEFYNCINPLLDVCPSIRHNMHSHWRNVYDVMTCVCSSSGASNSSCNNMTSCFESQQRSILTRRCDAYLKFNVKQRTRHKCHFLHENILCKEALVTSACSEDAGQLAFDIARIAANEDLIRLGCHVSRDANYQGFQYTDQCPTDFTDKLQDCEDEYIRGSKLAFHSMNDLVADGKKKDVKDACRSFKDYKSCVRPTKLNCRKGTKMIYDFDGRLRTYLLKLEYICNEVKEDYMEHLSCYQNVLLNETLKQCAPIWQDLQPLLTGVSAHQFYCLPGHNNTINLQGILSRLRGCYEEVFTAGCGSRGGAVIGGLMTQAFQDPFYLRYRYTPDCKLHEMPATTETVATTKSWVKPKITQSPRGKENIALGSQMNASSACTYIRHFTNFICYIFIMFMHILTWR